MSRPVPGSPEYFTGAPVTSPIDAAPARRPSQSPATFQAKVPTKYAASLITAIITLAFVPIAGIFAVLALIESSRVEENVVIGDIAAARAASEKASRWILISVLVAVGLVVLYGVLFLLLLFGVFG